MQEQLFTQALGLTAPWAVDSVSFRPDEGAIHFEVSCDGGRLACPACGNARLGSALRRRDDLEATIKRYVWLYNQHLPQRAIRHRTPIQTLKDWQAHKPEIFKKAVRKHPGPDK